MSSGNIGEAFAHESFAEKVSTDKVRLYIASFGSRATGGAVIQDVDFSSSSSNATVTPLDTWGYDTDRRSPQYRYSENTSQWNLRNVHSVQPAYFPIGSNIKNLKAFCRWASDRGYYEGSQFRQFKVLAEESEEVYLTQEELDTIVLLDLMKIKDYPEFVIYFSCNATRDCVSVI